MLFSAENPKFQRQETQRWTVLVQICFFSEAALSFSVLNSVEQRWKLSNLWNSAEFFSSEQCCFRKSQRWSGLKQRWYSSFFLNQRWIALKNVASLKQRCSALNISGTSTRDISEAKRQFSRSPVLTLITKFCFTESTTKFATSVSALETDPHNFSIFPLTSNFPLSHSIVIWSFCPLFESDSLLEFLSGRTGIVPKTEECFLRKCRIRIHQVRLLRGNGPKLRKINPLKSQIRPLLAAGWKRVPRLKFGGY